MGLSAPLYFPGVTHALSVQYHSFSLSPLCHLSGIVTPWVELAALYQYCCTKMCRKVLGYVAC